MNDTSRSQTRQVQKRSWEFHQATCPFCQGKAKKPYMFVHKAVKGNHKMVSTNSLFSHNISHKVFWEVIFLGVPRKLRPLRNASTLQRFCSLARFARGIYRVRMCCVSFVKPRIRCSDCHPPSHVPSSINFTAPSPRLFHCIFPTLPLLTVQIPPD